MKENGNRTYLTQGLSCWISDIAFSRFRSFCNHVLGVRIDVLPSEESIFMRQNFSIILCAAVLYLLTNGFYLVKHIIQKTMIPIDMIPLYMMVAASLAMLLFLALCKKYDSPLARFALLGSFDRQKYQKTNWWPRTAQEPAREWITIRTAGTVRKLAVL